MKNSHKNVEIPKSIVMGQMASQFSNFRHVFLCFTKMQYTVKKSNSVEKKHLWIYFEKT